MIRICHLLLVACCCAPAITWAAQTQAAPPRDNSARLDGPGTVRGVVTRADSGDPLPGALVEIMPDDLRGLIRVAPDGTARSGTFPETFTDERGRYVLESVPAGWYLIRVSKTGYLSLSYGQRTPLQRARRVQVGPAASVDGVAIALPRGAVIAGQVLDVHGEPMRGALVRAVRQRTGSGTALATAGNADRTDDLGMFRVHGLPAGNYLIEVSDSAPFEPTLPFPAVGIPVTYYPAARSASDAERVRVGTGEEVDALTVQMQPPNVSAIIATVKRADGQPVSDATVVLNALLANGGIGSRFVNRRDDGSYVIANLPPGSYGLRATGRDGTVTVAHVRLDGADVDVPLTLRHGSTLRARVFVNGQQPPAHLAPNAVSVELLADVDDPSTPELQRFEQSWTLEAGSMIGRKRLRVRAPNGFALQRITRHGPDGDAEVTDGTIDFSGDGTIDVDIHLTDRVTRLSGTVRDAQFDITGDETVIVFADDRARWGAGSRFVVVTHPNQDGRFGAAGLPPGQYLAVALADLEEGEETDVALLERLRPAATPVSLVEGEAKTVDIPIATR